MEPRVRLWGRLTAIGIVIGAALVVWAAWPGRLGTPLPSLRSDEVAVPEPIPHSLIGQPMPDVALVDVTGVTRKLSDYQGKTLVLVFWTSESSASRTELDTLKQLYPAWQQRGDVAVVTIDFGEPSVMVAKAVSDRGYPFPVLVDENGAAKNVYQVFYRPASFVIGPDGKVRDVLAGPVTADAWQAELVK